MVIHPYIRGLAWDLHFDDVDHQRMEKMDHLSEDEWDLYHRRGNRMDFLRDCMTARARMIQKYALRRALKAGRRPWWMDLSPKKKRRPLPRYIGPINMGYIGQTKATYDQRQWWRDPEWVTTRRST